MSILIVDDYEVNIYQLQFLLNSHHYTVVSAVNGAEALQMAQKDPPELIISDILMPVMDGFSLCREWMKDARLREIPFMFYTATYTDERDREFALKLGAVSFFTKPTEPDVMIEAVESALKQKIDPHQPVSEETLPEETGFLRGYNEALIRKLEDKMNQVEQINLELQKDITERKMIEQALQTSQSLLGQTEELGRIGGWELDIATFRLSWTDTIFNIYEIDTRFTPTLDQSLEYYTSESRPVIESAVKRAIAPGESFDVVVNINTAKNNLRTIHVIGRADHEQGKVVGFYQDITDYKRAEDERAKLEAQLQQMQRMESVGRLAGGVAHDFNNMLGVILGHTEIVLEQLDPSEPLYEDIEEIQKAATRSAELTRQLLTFARKQTVAPKVMSLNDTITGMLKMLNRMIGENINLVWHPKLDVWPLYMDPSQIDQLLANLCVNARDAIDDTGVITIETGNRTFDDEFCASNPEFNIGQFVKISVNDTGCGMSREVQAHIFEPFFTTKAVGQGTGLGLATVYGIVKQNNGFINVYSEPHHGTTFSIYIPRYAGATGSDSKCDAAKPVVPGQETVLIVEDEMAILRLVTKMLQQLGYHVLMAGTPGDAIRIAEEHANEIDLLITDVIMPEMNGCELSKLLSAKYNNMKCLYMSGYTADVITNRGELYDGVHFVQKPFTVAELAAKLRVALTSD